MFICNECLKENFTNNPSYMKSVGPCEICTKVKVCNDISSMCLIDKK